MEYYELEQMQSLPLEAKIVKTQARIREWCEHYDGNVYVSISGKDSAVVLDLVRQMYPKTKAVFCDTGVEWPEVKDYIRNIDNVDWIKPEISFKGVLDRYGYPVVSKEQARYICLYRNTNLEKMRKEKWEGQTSPVTGKQRYKISEKWKFLVDAPFKISDECCAVLKKRPFTKYAKKTKDRPKQHPLMGVMADDSNQRRSQYLKYGCNAFSINTPRSHPIGFWTDQDVLRYLKETKIDYPSIYGEIIEQKNGLLRMSDKAHTGCMYCLFGLQYIIGESNFERLKRLHPAKYHYAIEKLNFKEVIDFINDHLRLKYRIPY